MVAGKSGGGGEGRGFFAKQIARLRADGAGGGAGGGGAAASAPSSAAAHRAVSSANMLLFLTSRAADVSLLVTSYTWLREPHLARWRQMRGSIAGSGGGGAASLGGGGGGGGGGRSLGDASASPIPSASAVLVDVVALHARLCSAEALERLGGARDRVWTGACCGERVLSLVRDAAASAPSSPAAGLVPVSSLPTFQCRGSTAGAAAKYKEVSCAYARDDFCDCEGDAADEPDSSACSSSRLAHGAAFLCHSGVLEVSRGALVPRLAAPGPVPAGAGGGGGDGEGEVGSASAAASAAFVAGLKPGELAAYGYIHASKVRDGVKDCVGGEDEEAA